MANDRHAAGVFRIEHGDSPLPASDRPRHATLAELEHFEFEMSYAGVDEDESGADVDAAIVALW